MRQDGGTVTERGDHDARGPREGRHAPSGPASLDRRTGAGVRLLPERPDPHRQGAARQEPAPDRRTDPRRDEKRAVPLHDVLRDQCCREARRESDGMTTRREFLRTAGLLIASVGALSLPDDDLYTLAAQSAGPYVDPDFLQLDSWIVIRPDNTAT